MDDYRYLFPFEKIPKGSTILIYGAGILGQEYLKQILISNYCKVVGFVDKNYADYPPMQVRVFSPEAIAELSFDYVVLAIRTENWLSEIERVLLEHGVRHEQIVCVLERKSVPTDAYEYGHEINCSLAYETDLQSAAIFTSGGLGDMVMQKRFLMELLHILPNLAIDIYVVQNSSFPEWLYSDSNQIKNILLDLGFRYKEHRERYSLSIRIYGSSFLQVDSFRPECFDENSAFVEQIMLLKETCKKDDDLLATPDRVSFYRHIYRGEDCYSWYNHGNIFQINDRSVDIPLIGDPKRVFPQIGSLCYMTVNTGNGSCMDGKKIAKAWPAHRFEETLSMFKKKYPYISIVQVGTSDEESISGADFWLMGLKYDVLAHVLKHSVFHLDIEGGLVHLATQLGTKCVVLWGPTVFEYFAYKHNVNIRVGICHGCAGLYRDINKCARNMDEPECMYSIQPEVVMEAIDSVLLDLSNRSEKTLENDV